MRKSRLLFQVVTLFASILLAAAFISYRAGAFDALLGTSARETINSNQRDPEFMYGTKSGILIDPSAVQTAGGQVAPPTQPSQRIPGRQP